MNIDSFKLYEYDIFSAFSVCSLTRFCCVVLCIVIECSQTNSFNVIYKNNAAHAARNKEHRQKSVSDIWNDLFWAHSTFSVQINFYYEQICFQKVFRLRKRHTALSSTPICIFASIKQKCQLVPNIFYSPLTYSWKNVVINYNWNVHRLKFSINENIVTLVPALAWSHHFTRFLSRLLLSTAIRQPVCALFAYTFFVIIWRPTRQQRPYMKRPSTKCYHIARAIYCTF